MKAVDFMLVVISTGLLVVNQIALKFWLTNHKVVVWPLNSHLLKTLFSLEILISIISIFISAIIWLSLLKKIEFSILYPLISISYVFGMLAAVLLFHENVPLIRWVGLMLIILGIILITKN